MAKTNPPFRADHVGSLLRPAAVKDAREKFARGAIDRAGLAAIEDEAIRHAIAKQESVGLKSITDGEIRRAWWQWDFLQGLDGTESAYREGVQFQGATTGSLSVRVTGKLGFTTHPMLEHFRFLQRHTRATPKMTIPSPTMLTSIARDWRGVVSKVVYPDLDELYRDLGLAYRKAIRAFADAGCRYLQLDDCNIAFLCDPAMQQRMRDRGDDPAKMLRTFIALINSAVAERPAGMTIAMHSCRGNFRSTWLTEGGYEPVAEAVFGGSGVDAFFLEYDSDRAGGFEPLRHVGKDKTVVLGLISTKTGQPETKDAIKRRIEAAAKHVALDGLCLSPQCGFASTEEGNVLTEDEQWAKLASVVEIAGEVWRD
jgi:5-methyltetrahydropteroyltriglutamate--homocysteine methyltransferase